MRATRLGFALPTRGPTAWAAGAVGALTVVVAISTIASLARGGERAPVPQAVALASGALTWGAGVLLAFGGSVRALVRDRDEGLFALVRARGGREIDYVTGRVLGLALALGALLGGGALLVGLGALLVWRPAGAAVVAQATFASVVYAAVASGVLASVAMAALGPRSRPGGYLALVAVLVLPEILAGAAKGTVGASLAEVLSLPGALGAVRGGLMPGDLDLARVARGLVASAVASAVGVALVRARVARAARRGEA